MFQGTLPQRSQAASVPAVRRWLVPGAWSLGGHAADAATRWAQTEDRDPCVRNLSSILTFPRWVPRRDAQPVPASALGGRDL